MAKEYISMPLPIDNLFGESESRGKEILILIGVVAVLWIVWVVLLLPFGISFWMPLSLCIVFALYWLSEIWGKGKEKRKLYKRQLSGDLAEEHNLVGVTMIEDENVFFHDTVVNYLVGEFKFYTDGNQLTLDFERFLDGILPLQYNIYFVNLPIEEDFSDDAANVVRYVDKEVAQDRYNYYLYQQEVIKAIKCYSVVMAIHTQLDNIDKLHDKVESLLITDAGRCFTKLTLAKGDLLNVVLGSDLGYDCDINVLLDNKYYDSATMSSLKVIERG